ncbi:2-dehydro-3-deoxygluconokinase [Knoellia remsis]|uniref:2-dehydro-3-deoxygluconokinase n=1 Tax=Knoellia remsis TaxID=407159 RepID=A0A2T0UK70_9MICO|nr:sugar kinase [Knoellia remsis]PRY58248.1 2-dehydro-3-deoxygluconokinase [Knoellia remsis]
MTAPRVLCCGEPLVVLSTHPGDDLETAAELHVGVAGAELNVALHLARLGMDVRFAGAVGDDPFGDRVRAALVREGVDDSGLHEVPGHPTGVYFKQRVGGAGNGSAVHYYRAGSAATSSWPLTDDDLHGVGHVHVSGVSAAVSPSFLARLEQLTAPERSWTVSFDLNHRPALWPADDAGRVLRALARRCDIVLVGLDEAAEVWGAQTREEVREHLPEVPEIVVKDGPDPASVWADGAWTTSEPVPVVVVELVGAGDAFAAAYLASRLSGHGPGAAMQSGHVLAAHVIAETGDQGSPDAEAYTQIRETLPGRTT